MLLSNRWRRNPLLANNWSAWEESTLPRSYREDPALFIFSSLRSYVLCNRLSTPSSHLCSLPLYVSHTHFPNLPSPRKPPLQYKRYAVMKIINHPNWVRLLEVYENVEEISVVMQYASCGLVYFLSLFFFSIPPFSLLNHAKICQPGFLN